MEKLRNALLALFAESIGAVDLLSDEEEAVMDAWNKMCEESPTVGIPQPITEQDLEEFFED